MKPLSKPFPQPTTIRPMKHNRECELDQVLDLFHGDLHRSAESLTEEQDAECFAVFQEIVSNYTPHLTKAEWIALLGELVVGMYIDPGVVAARSRATSPFAVSV
jgi:hypothetical protein